MTREVAIAQLKMYRDLCNFNPMTGEEEPMNEEFRKLAEALDMAIIALEEPERIKGHWVEIASSNHTYKCSVCGRLLVNTTDGKNNVAKNYPYCHCGVDMRGEQDG